MLVLFETPAGYALFQVSDEGKLKNADLSKYFSTPESAHDFVQLKAFKKFEDTVSAMTAATAIVESKLTKDLKKFLKKNIKNTSEQLAVQDAKLGASIKDKLSIPCVANVDELFRGIRSQLENLIAEDSASDLRNMALGLSHHLSRYKLKFSPDKVDTMVIQAIGLLDDLDKELNTYAMRVREWYGWHFPELSRIIADHVHYAKVVKQMGVRKNAADMDFSSIISEEVEKELKDAAVISMGTDISEDDVLNIGALCDQVIHMSEYRATLFEYLRNRMQAIAPNLSIMVGELVGARLISHAGSLLNLAKHPASTVQILGAEKALFRALKTRHETPKYGLIYHASLVGQSAPKNKGKISRVLAAKTALSIRVDALGDKSEASIGMESRAKVETRLRQLEGGHVAKVSGVSKGKGNNKKYDPDRTNTAPNLISTATTYNSANDQVMEDVKDKKKKKPKDEETKKEKKRKRETEESTKTEKKKKKKKSEE